MSAKPLVLNLSTVLPVANERKRKRSRSSSSSSTSSDSSSSSGAADKKRHDKKKKQRKEKKKDKKDKKRDKKDKEKKKESGRSSSSSSSSVPQIQIESMSMGPVVTRMMQMAKNTTDKKLQQEAEEEARVAAALTAERELREQRLEQELAAKADADARLAAAALVQAAKVAGQREKQIESAKNANSAPTSTTPAAAAPVPVPVPVAVEEEEDDDEGDLGDDGGLDQGQWIAALQPPTLNLTAPVLGILPVVHTATAVTEMLDGVPESSAPKPSSVAGSSMFDDDVEEVVLTAAQQDEQRRKQLRDQAARIEAAASAQEQNVAEDDDDEEAGLERLLQYAKAVSKNGDGGAIKAVKDAAARMDFQEDHSATAALEKAAAAAEKPASHQRKLAPVNHAEMQYEPFEKVFYRPPPDIALMDDAAVAQLRKELDGAKVWGTNPAKPLKSWVGCGLNDQTMATLEAKGFEKPFAVQAVAIPILMSGRDLLVTAKTGSGKTLSYLLPLIRHVHAQRRARHGEGPIGLVMVPTHELAEQIVQVANDFCTASRLSLVPAYGGISIEHNMRQLNKGCDIMIATPGRLFDLLTSRGGRTMNLTRVTSVVVDEADRMFDDGFFHYVVEFLSRVRPDRQLCMTSSTMPQAIKKAVRNLLQPDCLELSVGGRPSPSHNVQQYVEFFDAPLNGTSLDPRFLRLLAILGDLKPEELVIIFMANKSSCDQIFGALQCRGYAGLLGCLYSGMDQVDRACALKDFETRKIRILIATAVAERGIDILHLDLVINYDMPDHMEAYINRVGRTGRAGKQGKAITFFQREKPMDCALASALAQGLEESGNMVPEELNNIALTMKQKREQGILTVSSNAAYRRGYGSARGYKFDEDERRKGDAARAPGEEDESGKGGAVLYSSDSDDDDPMMKSKEGDPVIQVDMREYLDATNRGETDSDMVDETNAAMAKIDQASSAPVGSAEANKAEALKKMLQLTLAERGTTARCMMHADYEINHLSQRLRGKLVKRDFLKEIGDATNTSITVNGVYKERKHELRAGEKLLFLQIRGESRPDITQVFRKLEELINEERDHLTKLQAGGFTGGAKGGKGGRR